VSSADSATQAAGPKEFEQLPNEGIDCCDLRVKFTKKTKLPRGISCAEASLFGDNGVSQYARRASLRITTLQKGKNNPFYRGFICVC
jgi:hypothetical protein